MGGWGFAERQFADSPGRKVLWQLEGIVTGKKKRKERKAKRMNARHSQKDKKRDKLLFFLLLNLISSSLNHMNKSVSLHTEFGLTQPLLTLTHYCSAPVFFDSAQ